jgi:hypothetical protein
MAAKQGPNIRFWLLNGIKCVLLVSVTSDRAAGQHAGGNGGLGEAPRGSVHHRASRSGPGAAGANGASL